MTILARFNLILTLACLLCVTMWTTVVFGGSVRLLRLLPACCLFLLTLTFSFPFTCPHDDRPFWSTYACTAAFSAILVNSSYNNVLNDAAISAVQILATSFPSFFESRFSLNALLPLIAEMLLPFIAGVASAKIAVGTAKPSGSDSNSAG